MTGKVWLIGAGPGDPGLLTLKAARALAQADVIVYDYLASEAIMSLVPRGCERIYVGKKAGSHTIPQAEIAALLVRLGREGKRVVRLKGGDPFVFGRGGEEAQDLAHAGVPFELVPGITSALAVPAYAGIPVTHRDHNSAFTILTGHEDPTKGTSTLNWAQLADPHQTLIVLMGMGNLANIVAALRTHGRSGDTPVAIVREGTKPAQETLVATLDTIVAEVQRTQFAAPAVIVIGDIVKLREEIRWFDRGPLFGKRVLITRPARQADAFAEQLWEHGAEPILAPTIAIGPPDDPQAADDAVARVRDYAWVVFTSQSGVEAFFERVARNRRDLRALGDTQVAAIGPKTADALAKHGVRVDFMPGSYIGEDIAAGLLERTLEGERVMVFRAQEARDVLPATLAKNGRPTDVVAAYKTSYVVPPDLAGRLARADIVTFASASSVRAFVHALGDDARAAVGGKTIACIGPITAGAATGLGLHVTVTARDFTADGLIAALTLHAATAKAQV